MGKQFARILIILLLTLLLSACSEEPALQSTAPAETAIPTSPSIPPETHRPTENTVPAPTETEAPATEAPTEPGATAGSTLPYLQRIARADQSIYEGPGYDYVFAGTVREQGTYTIVEEAWDYEGNLWGKLKSGAGWVDLTEIRSEDYTNALISANYADEYLLLHGAYHHCPGDESEYCIPIAFRAYGTLRDVALFTFEFSGADFVPGEDFFTLSEWNGEMPLVAELAFPGDMSTYGIRFLDENGVTHSYSIYISGKNGALILTRDE